VPKVGYRLESVAALPLGTAATNQADPFAKTFCSTLAHIDPSHLKWRTCNSYLETKLEDQAPSLTPIPDILGVVVVGGIFSQCFEAKGVEVFGLSLEHLANGHHLRAAIIHVSGVAAPSTNAATINDYLRKHPGDYLAVGHSKGTIDLMTAIQQYSYARAHIKVLASVAGAVNGSRLVDFGKTLTIAGFQVAAMQSGLGHCDI